MTRWFPYTSYSLVPVHLRTREPARPPLLTVLRTPPLTVWELVDGTWRPFQKGPPCSVDIFSVLSNGLADSS